jgi:hypothetical protein
MKWSTYILTNLISDEYNSMANSLYTICISASSLIMPTMSGRLYDTFGGNVDGYEFPVEE